MALFKKRTKDASDQVTDKNSTPEKDQTKDVGETTSKKRIYLPIGQHPLFAHIAPQEGYRFNSSTFVTDRTTVSTIMTLVREDHKSQDFGRFWGTNFIPSGLPDGVHVTLIDKIRRWDADRIAKARKTSKQADAIEESTEQKDKDEKEKKDKVKRASEYVRDAIQDGDAYLRQQIRLLITAPSLKDLDTAIAIIKDHYTDSLRTIEITPFHGAQRREFGSIFAPVWLMKGKGFDYPSRYLATQTYNVSQGIIDPRGNFVGQQVSDVSDAITMPDLNWFSHHAVFCNPLKDRIYQTPLSRVFAASLTQSALLENNRVVHLVLDDTDLSALGCDFPNSTTVISAENGEVNPFEIFGDFETELKDYDTHLTKMSLFIRRFVSTSEDKVSLLHSNIRIVLNEFYKSRQMWVDNAKNNRDLVRVVGLDHKEYPTLSLFILFAQRFYKSLERSADTTQRDIANDLYRSMESLKTSSGDIVDVITSPDIDAVKGSQQVIYKFNSLMSRNHALAMASLINLLDFAASSLGGSPDGKNKDVLIIHGAQHMHGLFELSKEESESRKYIQGVFDRLIERGGRYVLVYDSMEHVFEDQDFNAYDKASYTIFGSMSSNEASRYEEKLGRKIPPHLRDSITDPNARIAFMRRGFRNAVFSPQVRLGTPKDPAMSSNKRRSVLTRMTRKGHS